MEQGMMWLLAAGTAWGTLLAARKLIHFFQLESYQFPGYFRAILRNPLHALMPGVVMGVAAGALLYVWMQLYPSAMGFVKWALALAYFIGMVVGGLWWQALEKKTRAKKPFDVTPRIRRLYATASLIMPLAAVLLYGLADYLCAFALFPLLLPVWVAFSGLLAWPLEKLVSELYFRDAQRILRQYPDLIRIGITGSYGKTTVKHMVGTLLSEKYQTLITRASFNTPMGVTREIRESLLPTHQVFVAEMGARHVGDIRELVRLVHPSIGIVTSVGPQHLETFHSLDRVKRTKYELIDGLPEDGVAFFPNDGAICLEYYRQTNRGKVLSGLTRENDPAVWAENIKLERTGSAFDLCTKEGSIACHTPLLGEHNIRNIVLAASVALHLGVSLEAVGRGIAKLQPVEHRLQLLPDRGGVRIIDDAFNSNPQGAEAALQVLKNFPGRRVIVTAGMVELGREEAELNRKFGESMAGSTDVAILVGKKQTLPIQEGLKAAGFPPERMHVVANLEEAKAVAAKIVAPGDVVLFENDLPDQY